MTEPPTQPPTPPPSPPSAASYDDGRYRPRAALSYGWEKFADNPATLMVPMIVVFVGLLVTGLALELVLARVRLGDGATGGLLVSGLSCAVLFLVFQLLAAGLYRGALRVVDGRSFAFGELFEGWDRTQVVIAGVLTAAAVGVGTVLCVVPGLVIAFLTQFTLLFVVDRGLTAVDAVKASVRLVAAHPGVTAVFYLLSAAATALGALLCGIGLLVTVPVVLIGSAYTFRRLQGGPVAP
jgi:uncharacterized membrane protein